MPIVGKIGVVRELDVFLHVDGRRHGDLRLVEGLHHGRHDGVFLDLGQLALAGIDDAAIAAAAAAAVFLGRLGRVEVSYVDVGGNHGLVDRVQ